MKTSLPCGEKSDGDCNERFVEFLTLFAEMNDHESLFPRQCRVCETTFRTIAEYCCATKPKGHCLEDCRHLTKSSPFMMFYRHCTCGNTLVMTITRSVFPELDSFWEMIYNEAEESGRDSKEVIAEFADQFDSYLLNLNNTCMEEKE